MEVDRKKIESDDQIQMYILFLEEKFDPNAIQRKILELDGQPTLYLPKQAIMCAQIKVKTAEVLKAVSGIKNISPISYDSKIRKLKVKTDSSGQPLWHYKVDDKNNIYIVKNE